MPTTSPDAPIVTPVTLTTHLTINPASDLIWGPVLRQFPRLRFALTEGGVGWNPYFLERADRSYKNQTWTGQNFGDKCGTATNHSPPLLAQMQRSARYGPSLGMCTPIRSKSEFREMFRGKRTSFVLNEHHQDTQGWSDQIHKDLGPVSAITSVGNEEEVVTLANSTVYTIATLLASVMVAFSGMPALPPGVPSRGYKVSGLRPECSIEGQDQFLRMKPTWCDPKYLYAEPLVALVWCWAFLGSCAYRRSFG